MAENSERMDPGNQRILIQTEDISSELIGALFLAPLPMKGDLRDPKFWRLISDSNLILYKRLFGDGRKVHQLNHYADCCAVSGQRKQLLEKGHPEELLRTIGPGKDINIKSRMDLNKWLIRDRHDVYGRGLKLLRAGHQASSPCQRRLPA